MSQLAMRSPALFMALVSTAALAAQVPSVSFLGPNGQSRSFTASDLSKLAAQEIEATDPHSQTSSRYRGVALNELLALVGAPQGEHLRGSALATYVVVEARDDYRVVFSLAELDPGLRDTQVFLAFEKDGEALGDEMGPFRLVVPSDRRAARWVRQVVRVSVVEAPY
ncbi:MAG: molybdopterin-dependent oxidoreductase [Vicinamibacteria bacterium]